MTGSTNPASRALGLLLLLAAVVRAQAPAQKTCDVDENNPQQLAKASFMVKRAQGSQDARFVAQQLGPAIKTLTENPNMPNPVGRSLVLGRALVLWSMQPNVSSVSKRGALGFVTDPEGTIDLPAAIDSAFRVVEAANPECITETQRWRRSPAWVAMANDAVRLMNSNVDSAATIASRAVMLNPYAPYGYMVLAYAARQRDSASKAIEYYRKASQTVQYDTAFADVGAQSLSLLADAALDAAEAVDTSAGPTKAVADSTRKYYLAQANSALLQLQQDKLAAQYAASTRSGLCRVAIATGDTASLRRSYADALANPGKLSFNEAVDAGVCMSRAEMFPEAITFFQAAHTMNPYHRNALGNLARVLMQANRSREALPLAERAVELEPNDPDNLQTLTLAYAAIAKQAQSAIQAGTKRTPARPGGRASTTAPRSTLTQAALDSLTKIERAYTDSAVNMNQRKMDLAYKVELSNFTVGTDSVTLGGRLINQGQKSDPVTLHVDFMDNTGKIVASKEVTLSPAPSSSARFSVSASPSTGVSAFRYTVK
jgi:tetratricopeptide (TPR) repeat protein